MRKIALFPGTFDPVTLGHKDIIFRAARLFDKVYVGLGNNASKEMMFPVTKRKEWIDAVIAGCSNVESVVYTGLTVDCCKALGADFLVRGIRYMSDFDYEKSIADVNYIVGENIETLIFACRPAYHFISSSIVRDLLAYKADVSPFLPPEIVDDFSGNL